MNDFFFGPQSQLLTLLATSYMGLSEKPNKEYCNINEITDGFEIGGTHPTVSTVVFGAGFGPYMVRSPVIGGRTVELTWKKLNGASIRTIFTVFGTLVITLLCGDQMTSPDVAASAGSDADHPDAKAPGGHMSCP